MLQISDRIIHVVNLSFRSQCGLGVIACQTRRPRLLELQKLHSVIPTRPVPLRHHQAGSVSTAEQLLFFAWQVGEADGYGIIAVPIRVGDRDHPHKKAQQIFSEMWLNSEVHMGIHCFIFALMAIFGAYSHWVSPV